MEMNRLNGKTKAEKQGSRGLGPRFGEGIRAFQPPCGLGLGIWLEPALALLRKKTKEDWTEKHRNVARQLVLEGGWVQKKLFDGGRSQRHSESGSRRRKLQKRSGSGKVVLSRILSVKANGAGCISVRKSGSQRSTRAGACQ